MISRKQEILEKAMELVIREGIAALTMKRVAEQVGFSETAMYRHFRGKRELVISLIRMIRKQFDGIFSKADAAERPDVFLVTLIAPLLGYFEQVRGVTFQFLSESTYNRDALIRAELNNLYSSLVKRLADYLRGSQKRGEIRKEVDCEAAALLAAGIIQSLTIRYLLSAESIGLQRNWERVLDVFLKGVLA